MKDIIDSIIEIIKNTPRIYKDYWCHGEPHSYSETDYATIRAKLETLFSHNKAVELDGAKACGPKCSTYNWDFCGPGCSGYKPPRNSL